ncbi:MAG TPA: pirin family protein [Verrucomicrobiae bacterium]|nr:pirin family protein [Verrucomicrobiae bacterium]
MITIRKAAERGQAQLGWLNTHYTFSFADYHDPSYMGFRTLRVINDDIIAGGGGFGTHPHRDMEIITYVLSGALEHKDSMGNGRIIQPGEVQYMAAGTGVTHSEFNPSPTEPVHLLQMWIFPDRKGAKPTYAEKSLASAAPGQLYLIASNSGRDNSIPINQDADVLIGKFAAGDKASHPLKPNRHAWLQVAEGGVKLNGTTLNAGDGAAVTGESALNLESTGPAQIVLFDLN